MAVKYKNFKRVELGMDTIQVIQLLGKPDIRDFGKEDSTYGYRYSKDTGFLTEMVIVFDKNFLLVRKWVN